LCQGPFLAVACECLSPFTPLLTGAAALTPGAGEAKMLAVFESMDADGSGTVEVKELREFISSSAVRKTQLNLLLGV
jgi:Ca2+-binding EF-hand superfamily protein